MNAFFDEVLSRLDSGTPLVLVSILDQHGSAPRGAGARMLVFPDASIAGTVGGGRYEAEAIAAALEMHAKASRLEPGESAPAALMHYSLQGTTDMDMICGGALTLLLEYITDGPAVRSVFEAGSRAQQSRKPFVLLSRFKLDTGAAGEKILDDAGLHASGFKRIEGVERHIWLPETALLLPEAASPAFDPALLSRLGQLKGNEPRLVEHGGEHLLLEPFPRPFRLVLFGGGHVSLETAALANHVGFHNTIVEDRPEFLLPGRFPGSATELLPSLGECDCDRLLSGLEMGPCDGIVIVTRGHSHDRDALAAALRTKAGYVGMIGSKSKRAAVYAAMRQSGFSEASLALVHSPIGIAIGAESPAEIAVSIVAELIAWRKKILDSGVLQ